MLEWRSVCFLFGLSTLGFGPKAAQNRFANWPGIRNNHRATWSCWADLREDKMINPAADFWPIFGPLGPMAGPGSPWTGSGENIAGRTKDQPRRPITIPVGWYFVSLVPAAKRLKYK